MKYLFVGLCFFFLAPSTGIAAAKDIFRFPFHITHCKKNLKRFSGLSKKLEKEKEKFAFFQQNFSYFSIHLNLIKSSKKLSKKQKRELLRSLKGHLRSVASLLKGMDRLKKQSQKVFKRYGLACRRMFLLIDEAEQTPVFQQSVTSAKTVLKEALKLGIPVDEKQQDAVTKHKVALAKMINKLNTIQETIEPTTKKKKK